jgi:hypothetical protein
MIKKLIYGFLLIFVVFAFTKCDKGCYNLPASYIPLLRQGDTLIYIVDDDRKDTFRVTTLTYNSYHTGSNNVCYQYLEYKIDKVSNSIIDTSGFNQIHVLLSVEHGITLFLTRTNGTEAPFNQECHLDTLYKQILIGDKIYKSVNYFSLINSQTHCRNLYFSYEYGVLSIEINKHPIKLSEIRAAR